MIMYILCQLPPSTTIHSIIPVQFTRWTVFLHNFSSSPLWSTSWSETFHFILHTFLHPIIVFFHNIWPYHCNLFCCSSEIKSSIPSLSLNCLFGTQSIILIPHIHLTSLISAHWSATSFFSLQARSHFHATYYFAHNCCTISLSLSMIHPYW